MQETSFYQQYNPKIFVHGQRSLCEEASGAKVSPMPEADVVLDLEAPETRMLIGLADK